MWPWPFKMIDDVKFSSITPTQPILFFSTCFPNVSPRCSELITNIYGIFVIPKKIKFTIHIISSATDGFLAGCIHTLGAFTWAILSKGGAAIPPRNTNLAFDNKPPASSENCANQWTWIRFVCIWYSTHTHTHTHTYHLLSYVRIVLYVQTL